MNVRRVVRVVIVILLLLFPMLSMAKTIICNRVNNPHEDAFVFTVPATIGELPMVDFPYPADAAIFSLRDNNFLIIAIDHDDKSRTRLVISAQYQQATHDYRGQMVTDEGGNQLQLDNGPVICRLK